MNSIFKKLKKYSFLFFLLFFFLVPEIAQGWGFTQVCSWQEWLRFPATTFWCVLMWLFTAFVKLLLMLAFAFFTIPLMIIAAFLSMAIHILSIGIVPLLSVPVLDSHIVVEMWRFVRDLSSMFFILFFVLIGLSTILKIRDYEFKKSLPLLIIMALLINFSLVFTGVIIDIGNILTGIFLVPVQGGIMGFSSLLGAQNNILSQGLGQIWQTSWADPINSITVAVGLIAFSFSIAGSYLIVALVFYTIIFIFIFRIAILWMLAILSPLAFISYIFDNTRKFIWNRWFSNLVKWSIVAVPILFFMFIGLQVLNEVPVQFTQMTSGLPSDEITGGRITQWITFFMTPLISITIMFLGVIISMTVLPEAAQSAINASQKTGSMFFNAGKDGARRIPAVNKAEGRFMRFLESVPGGPQMGSYDQRIRKEKEAYRDALKDAQTDRLIKSLDNLLMKPAETAAVMEELGERKAITNDLFMKHGNKAETGGAKRSKMLSNVPVMAKDNEEFQKLMTQMNAETIGKINPENLDPSKAKTPEEKERQLQLIERTANLNESGKRKIAYEASEEFSRQMVNNIIENKDH